MTVFELILGFVILILACLTPSIWRYAERLRQERALAALEQELKERRKRGLLPFMRVLSEIAPNSASGARLGNIEEHGKVVTGASGQHKEMP
jgi:hypothetical protein